MREKIIWKGFYQEFIMLPSSFSPGIYIDILALVKKIFQISALRKNLDNNGDALQDNYRPTQAINGRTVYHHSQEDAGEGKTSFSTNLTLRMSGVWMFGAMGPWLGDIGPHVHNLELWGFIHHSFIYFSRNIVCHTILHFWLSLETAYSFREAE